MFNLQDRAAKLRYWQEFEKQMSIFERFYADKLRKTLNKQFGIAAYFIENHMDKDINYAIDRTITDNKRLLQEHYKRVATAFSKKTYKLIQQNFKSVTPTSIKEPIDIYWEEFNRWMAFEAARKIVRIQDTTKNTISKIISKGMQDQLSTTEIAKQIKKTSNKINSYRAQTIALTETHTVAVRSTDKSVRSTKLQLMKEWMSAKDQRTRSRDNGARFEHYKDFPNGANGEIVGMDESFVGTGEKMEYPGDSNGSAGNVVRCRCVLLYNTTKH